MIHSTVCLPYVGLLLALVSIVSSTKFDHENIIQDESKLQSQQADFNPKPLLQNHQPRSRSRLPRSDTQPSHNEAVLTHLAQQVSLLTAKVELLTNDLGSLRIENKELKANATTLNLELAQSTLTVQQQGTALQALLAEFADFRREEQTSWQRHNQSMSAVTADVSQLQTQLMDTQASKNLIQGELDTNSLKLATLQGNVTSVEARTTGVERITADLRTWRTNVTSDISSIDLTQKQIVSDVGDLAEKTNHTLAIASLLQSQVFQISVKQANLARTVIFHAELSEKTRIPTPHPPFPIVPDNAVINVGGAYDVTSGNFTAPVDGYYFFAARAVSGESSGGSSPTIELMVDDGRIAISSRYSSTLETVVLLRAGQRVWLSSYFSSLYGRGMPFTGFLIRPSGY